LLINKYKTMYYKGFDYYKNICLKQFNILQVLGQMVKNSVNM